MISVRLVGGPEARAALAARANAVMAAQKKAMTQSVNLAHRRVSENITGSILHVQTGRLRQSMQTRVAADGSQGIVGTNVEYARIHEYGGTIPPHEIRPRGAALMFVSPAFIGPIARTKSGKPSRKSSGGLVFARSVRHPGATVPARPYMQPALEESREEIRGAFLSAILAALKGEA